MTYFKFDIPKINENISAYNDIKQNCMEDINFVYRGLGYMESAWNDPSAYTFMEKLKKDKYNLNEYFNYLDSLHGEISQFKQNIDNICSRYGYRRNTITLKFDDSQLETCKKYLNDAIVLLNDCLNKIFPMAYYEYGCSSDAYALENEIKTIKKNVNSILNGITDIIKSINNEIEDSRFRMKRISGFEYNLKTKDYIWNTVDLDAKKDTIDVTSMMNYNATSVAFNDVDIKEEYDITDHSFITPKDNSVVNETKEISISNNGLNDYSNVNKNNNNLTLDNNTYSQNNSNNNVLFETNKTNIDLNDNVG